MKKTIYYLSLIAVVVITTQSCHQQFFRSNYKDTNHLIHQTKNLTTKPFLKAHLKNGNICILTDTWQVDTVLNVVNGTGTQYNFNRKKIYEGAISVPIDSVSIFETNKKITKPEGARMASLSILTAVDALVGFYCFTYPKACFGSCPTFYMNENDNFHYADAEGFSNAISPSLEYYDIDALNNTEIHKDSFSITMKNEALETHCVNDVKLLAYPRNDGERVYQSPDKKFYACENIYNITQSKASEGNITSLLNREDKIERFSLSDGNNLRSKEEIILYFDSISNTNNLGLVVDFRQTLMTTYFIYNAIAYMGDEVGDAFAKIENDEQTRYTLKNGIQGLLGDIDIYLWNNTKSVWELQDGLYETGPISVNKQIIALKNIEALGPVKIKIVLNRGLWRLDYVALTNIKQQVKPIEISPCSVLNKGKYDRDALSQINDTNKYLISMPGSEYKFNFKLPDSNTDYELFLYSKGYYLEWMRAHWVSDKNLFKLNQLVSHPKTYLKVEAQKYKRYETSMEQDFWDSKINTKAFSYYEH